MNLHITYDNIFIDYVISIARELNVTDDKFVVYTFDEADALKNVKSDGVLFAKHNSQKFRNIVGNVKQYKNIYIHWLEGPVTNFVSQVPKGINVIWCFWGGDGLELPHIKKNIFQSKSLKYFEANETDSLLDDLNPRVFYFNLKKKYHKRLSFKNHLKAIARVDYFAHYLLEDFEAVKSATEMNAKFIPFHYGAIEDIIPDNNTSVESTSNNILLGNSDTISNNHFEAIDQLASIDLREATVYCPLSYNGGKYAKDVANYGNKMLGKKFIPLLKFLPKQEYDRLLSGINCAIMNHNRSQALGNISTLLWNGVKLYMSESSSLFHFLKKNNCKVFSLQRDLSNQQRDFFAKPTEEEVSHNRKILLQLFGRSQQKEKIKAMLTI